MVALVALLRLTIFTNTNVKNLLVLMVNLEGIKPSIWLVTPPSGQQTLYLSSAGQVVLLPCQLRVTKSVTNKSDV